MDDAATLLQFSFSVKIGIRNSGHVITEFDKRSRYGAGRHLNTAYAGLIRLREYRYFHALYDTFIAIYLNGPQDSSIPVFSIVTMLDPALMWQGMMAIQTTCEADQALPVRLSGE